jgi:hypothetical protein
VKIKLETADWESRIIDRIIERTGVGKDKRMQLELDLRACHCNGTPLQLDALLSAEPGDFFHDIRGIQAHMNRATGKLDPAFAPQCAVANHRKAA